jgi:hypothetical protein
VLLDNEVDKGRHLALFRLSLALSVNSGKKQNSVNGLVTTGRQEVHMVLIRVQYDAYNRQFKLLDRELVHALGDGEIYMVLADVVLEDLKLQQNPELERNPVIPAAVDQTICV